MLNADGWEHANAYHAMLHYADQGMFMMVLPGHTIPEGTFVMTGSVVKVPALVSPSAAVRRAGFVGLAGASGKIANDMIEKRQA